MTGVGDGVGTKLAAPEEVADWRTTGLWLPEEAVPDTEFAAAGHHLFDGPFTWPVMIARRTALDHNVATLADFCRRHRLDFAPHGKTTMAPSLFQAQLDAGAWGITAATASQALIYARLGVPRVLLANELLDPRPLAWLAAREDLDLLFYVDSAAGVEVAAHAAAASGQGLRVLVELGFPGGRTGCRTLEQLDAVAAAVAEAPGVELAGVSGYEGGLPDADAVRSFLQTLREGTLQLHAGGQFPGDRPVVVSAGGSAWFDLVAAELAGNWLPGRRLQVILRSGAYVTHDDGIYRHRTPFSRIGEGSLRAALEVWAQVTSVPEPGLAIAGMGKREAPYDEGLPEPQRVRRRGRDTAEPLSGVVVERLNDHHAYLRLTGPATLAPGDLVGFGISHPCTAFDHWRVIPVVDDDDRVTDLIRTYF